MDIATLGAAIAIAKKLPDTAAGRAETAQAAAEAAAETAQEYGYYLTIDGTGLIIGQEGDD